ncbi:MAG TPA: CapA family protein [Candidatus Saccharimonadia bacterium]|nr:CapA family protein [Candidatus Saccharimonadia bacterium]
MKQVRGGSTKKWLTWPKLLVVLAAVVLVGVGVYTWTRRAAPIVQHPVSSLSKSNDVTKLKQPDTSQTIRFIATGDELPHDTVNQAAKTTAGYDYLPFYAKLQPYLTSADMSFCNQESPSDPSLPVSGYPTFNAPQVFAQDLSKEGCNIINLANNHADDRGQAGIDATRGVWDNLPKLAIAGTARSSTEQNQIAYFTVRGVKFAFLSYAQCSNNTGVSSYGLNIFSVSLASAQIAQAKQHADMIIAAMHSCDENRSDEDTWQDQTAQYFADQGVNIVVGTGPHWLQTVKRLPRAGGGTTVVWFSLGNLLSTQEDVNGLIGGIGVMDIDVKSKTVTNLGFMPTYMHYEWTAQQKAAEDLLARHNLMLYPLDQAADALARSQNNTTVAAQTQRVTTLMNQFTSVKMLTGQTFSK